MSLSAAGPGAVWRWARYAPRRHRLRGHEFVPGIRRVELNLERRGPIRTPEGRHEIPTHRTRRLPLLLVRLRVAGGRGRARARHQRPHGTRAAAGHAAQRGPGGRSAAAATATAGPAGPGPARPAAARPALSTGTGVSGGAAAGAPAGATDGPRAATAGVQRPVGLHRAVRLGVDALRQPVHLRGDGLRQRALRLRLLSDLRLDLAGRPVSFVM